MNVERLIRELSDILEEEEDVSEGTQVYVGLHEVSQLQVDYDEEGEAFVKILIDD